MSDWVGNGNSVYKTLGASLSCPLSECKPNVCKRYEAEKEKLLKSLKRKRMK